MKYLVTAILCMTLIWGSFTSSAEASQAEIDRKTQQIQNIEQQIKQIEGRKAQTEQQRAAREREAAQLRSQIGQLNADINTIETRINDVGVEIEQKDTLIASTTENIQTLEEQINEQKQNIAKLIKEMYQRVAFRNDVAVALSTDTISDVFSEIEYTDGMQEQIRAALSEVVTKKDALAQEQEKLNAERGSLATAQENLRNQQIQIQTQRNQTATQVQASQNAASQLNSSLSSLSAQEQQLRQQMSTFYAELVSMRSRVISSADSPLGTIIWPSNSNRCTQGYGMTRFAQTGAYGGAIHNGVDIGGSGNPVYAVASGTVVGRVSGTCPNSGYSSCGGGWGNWVAIRHASGHVTLYAHLAGAPAVGVGQGVTQGSTIGYIGNSGFSTGPHLHFGIYQAFGLTSNGNPSYGGTINPEAYYNVSCWR